MYLPKNVIEIIEKLNNHGYTAYVVGGAVRDAIMGKTPHDYDITTSALPDEVKELFPNHFPLGEKFGTVSVVYENCDPVEVTTYRKDSEYTDGRHPNEVIFVTDLFEDLKRRDFTMNAIAYNPSEGFVDPFNGLSDIANKLVKSVNNPVDRFTEDGLRVLRALRFASQLEFSIEENTHQGMLECIDMIDCVAAERIGPEFVKMLIGPNAEFVLKSYPEFFVKIIHAYGRMLNCKQNTPYHIYDVEDHTIKVVVGVPAEERVRLAAFFHDFGKPRAKTTDENGIDHFYGHAEISARLTEKYMSKLRFSSKLTNEVMLLVKYHDALWTPTKKIVRKLMAEMGEDLFLDLIKLRKADILAQAPRVDDSAEKALELFHEVKSANDALSIKDLDINGYDVMNIGAVGPQIGQILKTLLEEVMDDKIKNEHEVLILRAKELKKVLD